MEKTERTELQSLFCWKVVCNTWQTTSDVRCARAPSCSPCFAGRSYATADIRNIDLLGADLLQSLFCWKVVCNRTVHHPSFKTRNDKVAVLVLLEGRMQLYEEIDAGIYDSELQSLFCWKVVCNMTPSSPFLQAQPRCSPCFAGRSYATVYDLDLAKRITQVAVLVLLEGRMQPGMAKSISSIPTSVAVLVLLEGRMQPVGKGFKPIPKEGCSPCFAGRSYATGTPSATRPTSGSGCSPCFAGRSYATPVVSNLWPCSVGLRCSPCFAGRSYATVLDCTT